MSTRSFDEAQPDPRLLRLMRRLAATAACLVLALPIARQTNVWVGWLPLWLLAMPMLSWWSLYRFRLSRRASPVADASRRRSRTQARRIHRQRNARGAQSAPGRTGGRAGLC